MTSKYAIRRRGSGRRYVKDEDFEESDVWCVMENTEVTGSSPAIKKTKHILSTSTFNSSASSATRLVPISSNSMKEANHDHFIVKQASAPMGIPDKKMISRSRKSVNDGLDPWADHDYNDDDNYDDGDDYDYDCDGEEEEEEGEGIVPPHEYIARRQARREISSFSVCEGFGRTLKGRDLSQVRNDILRKTGFLES